MVKRYVDGEKVLESLLYITNSGVQDVWRALKLLFYAEKIHIETYGQSITGDVFIAMNDGPVPSFAYDLIKKARGTPWCEDQDVERLNPQDSLITTGTFRVDPKRKPNLSLLSEAALEALDKSLSTYGSLSDEELSKLAHSESCYLATQRNNQISMSDYLEWLDLSPEVKEYLLV
ncbi:MAG TPA: Panacea domain-containing protein [Anaerolineaceae bacterium]|nr:Panacea domain-containing protein [Anaerolineaceae bacterium]